MKMGTNQEQQIKGLHEKVSSLVKEKEPEFYNTGLFQCRDQHHALYYAMDRSSQEVRRDIAKGLIEIYNAHNSERDVAGIFRRYALKEEMKTPINERGDVYCSDLDLIINPEQIYEKAMVNEDFLSADHIAYDFGLGKVKKDAARIKYVEEEFRDGQKSENNNINTLPLYYDDLKECGVLASPLGKEVAKEWYDCLMNTGRMLGRLWLFDTEYYTEAKQVAEEADLGQELVDQAKKKKPGFFLANIFTPIRRMFMW